MVPGEGPTGSEIADVERGSRRGVGALIHIATFFDAGQDAPPTRVGPDAGRGDVYGNSIAVAVKIPIAGDLYRLRYSLS